MICKTFIIMLLGLVSFHSYGNEETSEKLNTVVLNAVNECGTYAMVSAANMSSTLMKIESMKKLPEKELIKINNDNYKSFYKTCLEIVGLKIYSTSQAISLDK